MVKNCKANCDSAENNSRKCTTTLSHSRKHTKVCYGNKEPELANTQEVNKKVQEARDATAQLTQRHDALEKEKAELISIIMHINYHRGTSRISGAITEKTACRERTR